MQRLLGNGAIQAKLQVSQPGDPQEREADRVADDVMRMPEPVATLTAASGGVGTLQRKCAACEEESDHVQRKTDSVPAPPMPAGAESPLAGLGAGAPLPASERAYFEPRFGYDFSRVNVHTGARASESARSLGAHAYTLGQDVVFAEGRYAPGTGEGRRLLAHELAHSIQQRAGIQRVARQCDPAWASLPWSQRVNNVNGMEGGTPRNQCKAEMLDEVLDPSVTVEDKTNSSSSVAAAVRAGRYVELGPSSNLHVNFDENLNAKSGMAAQYGQTTFRTPSGGTSIIFMVLGPKALDPFGTEVTLMAFEHENHHAQDLLAQIAGGNAPHVATAGEELAVYVEGFIAHFLNFWTIDNTPPGSFSLVEDFPEIFPNFAGATQSEQDAAFDSLKQFFDGTITGNACNVMKFKIWLQGMQNARPAGDALVARLDTHTGFGLTRGTTPETHYSAALACS
jgi:hypothetical protein